MKAERDEEALEKKVLSEQRLVCEVSERSYFHNRKVWDEEAESVALETAAS